MRLAAGRRGAAVPHDVQCLVAPVRKSDQVLLQGVESEGVCDFELPQLAARVIRLDQVLVVLAEKTAGEAAVFKADAGKIPQYVSFHRRQHGLVVV